MLATPLTLDTVWTDAVEGDNDDEVDTVGVAETRVYTGSLEAAQAEEKEEVVEDDADGTAKVAVAAATALVREASSSSP
jgi:hypothetical protein